MAVVTPLPSNKCVGVNVDGSANDQLYCLKGNDAQGNPIYTCATWRYFLVQCPSINQLCSSQSGAWVAAVTVCNQKLFN